MVCQVGRDRRARRLFCKKSMTHHTSILRIDPVQTAGARTPEPDYEM